MRLLKKFGAVLYLAAAIVVVGGFACAQFAPSLISRRVDALLAHPAGRIVLIVSLVIVGAGVLLSALFALLEQRPPSRVQATPISRCASRPFPRLPAQLQKLKIFWLKMFARALWGITIHKCASRSR